VEEKDGVSEKAEADDAKRRSVIGCSIRHRFKAIVIPLPRKGHDDDDVIIAPRSIDQADMMNILCRNVGFVKNILYGRTAVENDQMV